MLCVAALLVMFIGQNIVAGMLHAPATQPTCHSPSCRTSGTTGRQCQAWWHKNCFAYEQADMKKNVLLNRLQSFTRRPSPPLPSPSLARASFPGADYSFLTLTLLIWCGLAGEAMGILPPVTVQRRYLWLVYPFSQVYLHLAQAGLGPLIGAEYAPPSQDTVGVQMFALFACLLMQALCFIIFCTLGPNGRFSAVLHPPTCIYLCAFTYYTYRAHSSQVLVVHDWTGEPMYPLHLCMWMASTSVQCVLWNQIYHEQCVTMKGFRLPSVPLLLAQLMLWSGLLGHLDYGEAAGIAPNVALNTACFVFFFALLHHGTRPLRLAVAHYHRLGTIKGSAGGFVDANDVQDLQRTLAAMKRLETHFWLAHNYVWVTWQGFPLVWALGVAGVVGGATRENLYSVCDLFAKFLPVSMYLSLLDVRY